MTMDTKPGLSADEFAALSPDRQLRSILLLEAIVKRATAALKTAKTEWARTHDEGSHDPLTLNGADAGTLTVTRSGVGRPTVADPVRYAQWLMDHGYETMTVSTPQPSAAACTRDWLDMIRDSEIVNPETGEIVKPAGSYPAGVEYKPGAASSVKITNMPKDTIDRIFTGTDPSLFARLLIAEPAGKPANTVMANPEPRDVATAEDDIFARMGL